MPERLYFSHQRSSSDFSKGGNIQTDLDIQPNSPSSLTPISYKILSLSPSANKGLEQISEQRFLEGRAKLLEKNLKKPIAASDNDNDIEMNLDDDSVLDSVFSEEFELTNVTNLPETPIETNHKSILSDDYVYNENEVAVKPTAKPSAATRFTKPLENIKSKAEIKKSLKLNLSQDINQPRFVPDLSKNTFDSVFDYK